MPLSQDIEIGFKELFLDLPGAPAIQNHQRQTFRQILCGKPQTTAHLFAHQTLIPCPRQALTGIDGIGKKWARQQAGWHQLLVLMRNGYPAYTIPIGLGQCRDWCKRCIRVEGQNGLNDENNPGSQSVSWGNTIKRSTTVNATTTKGQIVRNSDVISSRLTAAATCRHAPIGGVMSAMVMFNVTITPR